MGGVSLNDDKKVAIIRFGFFSLQRIQILWFRIGDVTTVWSNDIEICRFAIRVIVQ